jgi:DNA-binding transcriptional regulator/RsmH inhibitor MraZ
VFQGRHEHLLDEKGRTSLPKGFRTVLEAGSGNSPWITTFGARKGEEPYLVILPDPLFQAIYANLAEMNPLDANAR